MLNFPPPIAARLSRAVETLRMLAGVDPDNQAKPLRTDPNGVLQVAISNWREVFYFGVAGSLTVNTYNRPFTNTTGRTLTFRKVHLAVGTAPTGAAVILDVNKNGSTIFTTPSKRPQIAAGARAGFTTAFDVTTLADGEYVTFDVDQVGSSAPGADLIIQVILD